MEGKQDDITERIVKEGYSGLKLLYKEVKPAFMEYTLRYSRDFAIRQDAFHEAMIAFYEYCLAGKYDYRKSSPKTMIYRMGTAYLINRLKRENRILPKEVEELDGHVSTIMISQERFSLDKNEEVIKEAESLTKMFPPRYLYHAYS